MVAQSVRPRLRKLWCFVAVVVLLPLAGCIRGHIYQDITVPFDDNMNPSDLGEINGVSSAYRLKEPITGANVTVEWNSYGLGSAMKNGRLDQALLIDVRKQSAVFGIWRRDTLVVNGRELDVDLLNKN